MCSLTRSLIWTKSFVNFQFMWFSSLYLHTLQSFWLFCSYTYYIYAWIFIIGFGIWILVFRMVKLFLIADVVLSKAHTAIWFVYVDDYILYFAISTIKSYYIDTYNKIFKRKRHLPSNTTNEQKNNLCFFMETK